MAVAHKSFSRTCELCCVCSHLSVEATACEHPCQGCASQLGLKFVCSPARLCIKDRTLCYCPSRGTYNRDSAGEGSVHDDGVGGLDQKLMGWAVPHEDIEICRHSDGKQWLLVRRPCCLS